MDRRLGGQHSLKRPGPCQVALPSAANAPGKPGAEGRREGYHSTAVITWEQKAIHFILRTQKEIKKKKKSRIKTVLLSWLPVLLKHLSDRMEPIASFGLGRRHSLLRMSSWRMLALFQLQAGGSTSPLPISYTELLRTCHFTEPSHLCF